MVERICPACRHTNPLERSHCMACGASLERLLPAVRHTNPLVRALPRLPVNWKRAGRTMAIGLVAVAAEVGVELLRRRLAQPAVRSTTPETTALVAKPADPVALPGTTIYSRRVIDITNHGDGRVTIDDRAVWHRQDT